MSSRPRSEYRAQLFALALYFEKQRNVSLLRSSGKWFLRKCRITSTCEFSKGAACLLCTQLSSLNRIQTFQKFYPPGPPITFTAILFSIAWRFITSDVVTKENLCYLVLVAIGCKYNILWHVLKVKQYKFSWTFQSVNSGDNPWSRSYHLLLCGSWKNRKMYSIMIIIR